MIIRMLLPLRPKSHLIPAVLFFFLIGLVPTEGVTRKNQRGVGLASDSVKALPANTKRYALVIGVDQYADTQITTLGGASNDAKTLANALIQYAGFPGEQVTLLASDQPAERQPTRGNILRRLSNMAAVIPPDGLLLISFAGHGIERGGQAFLLPSDSQVSNDVDLLEQTAINVSQIKDRVKKIGVKQVLMILDACRNDPVGRANADNPLTSAYTRGFNFDLRNREVQAFATLYATEIGHRAYEYKEKKQGYFTWVLVEALRGGAANAKGEVTLGALVRYLQERVPKRVLQDLGPGKDQKPFAVVEGYRADDLVISVRDARAAATQPYTPDMSTQTNAPGRDASIELNKTTTSSLEGTTWTGNSPEAGEYTMKFVKDGQLQYIINVMQNGVTAPRTIKGTWKQAGNDVQIVIGNSYSVLQGTLEGSVMKGSGTNQEGTSWKWMLLKKE
ncbi:MAG TPA: caspase family protein [Pyrinomonadaceae bacterium]|nr:caspase family protein [Pyrinomonadaceae bacterium]